MLFSFRVPCSSIPELPCTQDGQVLPSPVKFDLPVAVGKLPPYVVGVLRCVAVCTCNDSLPSSLQPNHLPSADTKALLVTFLEQ